MPASEHALRQIRNSFPREPFLHISSRPPPAIPNFFWAKIRISKSEEENLTRVKRSATSFTQTHPSPQVRPLPGQDTPTAAEPFEPRAPRCEGGGRAGQTATLQNLIRIPAVGLQFFRAGTGS